MGVGLKSQKEAKEKLPFAALWQRRQCAKFQIKKTKTKKQTKKIRDHMHISVSVFLFHIFTQEGSFQIFNILHLPYSQKQMTSLYRCNATKDTQLLYQKLLLTCRAFKPVFLVLLTLYRHLFLASHYNRILRAKGPSQHDQYYIHIDQIHTVNNVIYHETPLILR